MKQNNFKQFAKGQPKVSKEGNNNAVIYTRVSTKEQAENNGSLETQKKYCFEYATKHHLNILGYFGGTYESAQTDERDEFNRMMKYVRNQKSKVDFILVYTLDRFSRSGENAIYISSELHKQGIGIVAVTQPIDTTSHAGTLQQNIQFIFSKYDNDLRRQKAIDGMRETIRKGIWMGNPPMGYTKIKEGGVTRMVINEKGKLLQKAFNWKVKEGYTNTEILSKLKAHGLDLKYKQAITKILTNPFYCGMIAHSMLDGEVIKGTHPAIVSPENFIRLNTIQRANHISGYRHRKENPNLPLRQFVHCERCNSHFTGYIAKKRIYYYKCSKIGCRCNRNADEMHDLFKGHLSQYTLTKDMLPLAKQYYTKIYSIINSIYGESKKKVEINMDGIKQKIDKVEERFIYGEIDRSLYEKYIGKLKGELTEVSEKADNWRFQLSNAGEYVEYGVEKAISLSEMWHSTTTHEKVSLQKLVFPDGILYSKENGNYRTPRVHSLFEVNPLINNDFNKNKKGLSEKLFLKVPSGGPDGIRTRDLFRDREAF